MRKLAIFVTAIALLSLTVLAIVPETSYKTPIDAPRRYGVERVTHYDPRVNFARIDTTVYLSPVEVEHFKGVGRGGYAPLYPRGTARVRSSTWYGYPRAQVNIMTKDLPPSYEINSQFETWLVDAETGQRLSVGTFTTGFGGIGTSHYVIDNYFDPYDFVEITVEPFDDMDVSPGPVALIGRIPPPRFYNPAPKSGLMITQTFSEY